jgi:LPXTG-motif cell wall-anchored protein
MQQRNSYLRRTALGVGSIIAGGLIVVAALPGSAGAVGDQVVSTTSTSVVTDDNPTCGEFGYDFEFKIDEQPVEGTVYDDPDSDLVVTITDVTEGDPMTFSFTTNIAVSAVFVKSGNGGILYTFDPPTTVGTDLESPNDSISHVSFCWDEDTTTTTEKETTTSTTHKDTTTSTTHKDTTTSTTVGGTTTTMQGATTTAGQASTTVAAVTTPTTRPSGGLPRTGTNTVPLLALAALLVGGGTALVAATRRSRSS